MKKKHLVLLIVAGILGLTIFSLWSAKMARKQSDTILQNFRTVDQAIRDSNARLDRKLDSLRKQINP